MRFIFCLFSFVLFSGTAFSQTPMVEKKAGHVYKISVPNYMTKSLDLNESASFQYQSLEKDAYVIVIEDSKEDLQLSEMIYKSALEFYNDFIKDYATETEKRKVTEPVKSTVNGNSIVQSELTYTSEGANIYMVVSIVETKTHFYKVLSWTVAENKATLKTDLFAIAKTLKEIE